MTMLLFVCSENPVDLQEDLLSCSPSELNQGLSQFVQDAVSPRGPCVQPPSVFYLCLGIQQVPPARQPDTRPMSRYTLKRSTDQAACIICLFVFESTFQSCVKVYVYFQPKPLSQWFLHVLQFLLENSRMVNIFTDQVYSSFARQLDGVLSGWVPLLNTDGIMTPSHMYRSSFMYCTLHN